MRAAAERAFRALCLLGAALLFLVASDATQKYGGRWLLLLPLVALAICLGSGPLSISLRRAWHAPFWILFVLGSTVNALAKLRGVPTPTLPAPYEGALTLFSICGVAILLCTKGKGEAIFASSLPKPAVKKSGV